MTRPRLNRSRIQITLAPELVRELDAAVRRLAITRSAALEGAARVWLSAVRRKGMLPPAGEAAIWREERAASAAVLDAEDAARASSYRNPCP